MAAEPPFFVISFCITGLVLSASRGGVLGLGSAIGISTGTVCLRLVGTLIGWVPPAGPALPALTSVFGL